MYTFIAISESVGNLYTLPKVQARKMVNHFINLYLNESHNR